MSVDCDDKSLLMAYLYGECDAGERRKFERHLEACAACRHEFTALRSVRGSLQEWAPPETTLNFRIVSDEAPAPAPVLNMPAPRRRWTTALPAWAQLAAAVLVLAVGAAIANLDVRFGNGGVTVRTGWQAHAPETQAQGAPTAQPWRAELAALERNLRRDLATTPVSDGESRAFSPAASSTPTVTQAAAGRGLTAAETAELARRFQVLIDDSERRQQQTFEHLLATRLVQFARDVDAQRRSDLVRIEQGLGQVDTRTSSQLAQMRELQRYLLRNVNIQEIK